MDYIISAASLTLIYLLTEKLILGRSVVFIETTSLLFFANSKLRRPLWPSDWYQN